MVYFTHSPQRFDIVQIIDLANKQMMIKRIIGLPNENIILKDGNVYVQSMDGKKTLLIEPYLISDTMTTSTIPGDDMPYPVGDNQYFVMGDNRPASIDSRSYGPVDRSDIVGKVMESKR